MSRMFAQPMPDWTDREPVAAFAAAGAGLLGDARAWIAVADVMAAIPAPTTQRNAWES